MIVTIVFRVWYWNCFPGARTDTDIPSYEYSMEGLYKDWKWSERFPSRQEVLRYFQYVDEKLDLSKDVMLNTRADGADFDTKSCRWNVKLSTGEVSMSRARKSPSLALEPQVSNASKKLALKPVISQSSNEHLIFVYQ